MFNNTEKIRRKKFISYSLLLSSAIIFISKIPLIKYFGSQTTSKKITLKSNPLSVSRTKSGETNV